MKVGLMVSVYNIPVYVLRVKTSETLY